MGTQGAWRGGGPSHRWPRLLHTWTAVLSGLGTSVSVISLQVSGDVCEVSGRVPPLGPVFTHSCLEKAVGRVKKPPG